MVEERLTKLLQAHFFSKAAPLLAQDALVTFAVLRELGRRHGAVVLAAAGFWLSNVIRWKYYWRIDFYFFNIIYRSMGILI